jgi:hypothetical protein
MILEKEITVLNSNNSVLISLKNEKINIKNIKNKKI